MKNTLFLFLALAILISCGDDDNQPTSTNNLLVLNEGAFLQNNASISSYNLEQETVDNSFIVNLGDILQDAVLMKNAENEDVLVASINNSNEVAFIDPATMMVNTRITVDQPRYITFRTANSTTVYVSSLDSFIHEIDIETGVITQSIKQNMALDDIEIVGESLYGVQRYSDKLHRFNLDDLGYSGSEDVLFDPASIDKDDQGNLWVICSGDVFGAGETGGIIEYNTTDETQSIAYRFEDKKVGFSPRIAVNPVTDNILFTKDNVYELNNGVNTQIGDDVYTQIYGLGVDPFTGDIYTADALGFDQAGIVRRLSSTGDSINQFNAGVAPNGFIFL